MEAPSNVWTTTGWCYYIHTITINPNPGSSANAVGIIPLLIRYGINTMSCLPLRPTGWVCNPFQRAQRSLMHRDLASSREGTEAIRPLEDVLRFSCLCVSSHQPQIWARAPEGTSPFPLSLRARRQGTLDTNCPVLRLSAAWCPCLVAPILEHVLVGLSLYLGWREDRPLYRSSGGASGSNTTLLSSGKASAGQTRSSQQRCGRLRACHPHGRERLFSINVNFMWEVDQPTSSWRSALHFLIVLCCPAFSESSITLDSQAPLSHQHPFALRLLSGRYRCRWGLNVGPDARKQISIRSAWNPSKYKSLLHVLFKQAEREQ